MKIFFDMDGTIANFYGVDGWLEYLNESDTTPYEIAEPLLNLSRLARELNRLQKSGIEIGIISWLSKTSNRDFDMAVERAKYEWLAKHLPSVHWDEIHIVKYGTPKQMFAKSENDYLFDDERPNRENWSGQAFDVNDILGVLRAVR